MYGTIIGDVVGSYYEVLEVNDLKNRKVRFYDERIKIMDKNTPLFTSKKSITDDSILTCAIADAILNKKNYEEKLREYGLREISFGNDMYNRGRFGKGFINWLNNDSKCDSFGNGCAMRISSVGYLFDDVDTIKKESKLATITSHNHPDSIKCSEAVAVSIYLLRNGISKDELKKYIEDNYFKLDYDLEELRHNYKFTSKAIDSVPQSIFCFLESTDFENAIRTAISIGGDSDTIACITGSLAESFYGVPNELIKEVKPYIKDYMKPIINKFYIQYIFNNFLKDNNISKDFLDYIKDKTLIVPNTSNAYGCFPILNEDGKLISIRLLVPEMKTQKDLCINIHEYTHAFELYKELGSIYIEDRNNRELRASNMEKKYVKRDY